MHLGNARTALLAWLQARAARGRILLRIEDLDPDRSRPEHEASLRQDLAWLGLEWDGEAPRQSLRADAYAAALARLEAAGLVYPCFCTRAEVRAAVTAPHGPGDEGPRYPGTCRALTPAERTARRAAGRTPSYRLRVPAGEVAFLDAVHGPRRQDVAAVVGDFVLRRADGVHAYQLAVTVDDAEGITHVLRGDDLLDSTPRQLLLARLLDLPSPAYAHVPLLVGADRARLAKRHGAVGIRDLRAGGRSPDELVGLLAASAGLAEPGERLLPDALVPRFSLDALPRSPTTVSALLPAAAPVAGRRPARRSSQVEGEGTPVQWAAPVPCPGATSGHPSDGGCGERPRHRVRRRRAAGRAGIRDVRRRSGDRGRCGLHAARRAVHDSRRAATLPRRHGLRRAGPGRAATDREGGVHRHHAGGQIDARAGAGRDPRQAAPRGGRRGALGGRGRRRACGAVDLRDPLGRQAGLPGRRSRRPRRPCGSGRGGPARQRRPRRTFSPAVVLPQTGVAVDTQAGLQVSCLAVTAEGRDLRLCASAEGIITEVTAGTTSAKAGTASPDVLDADLEPPAPAR
jgi:glutamyl-tRNA synthetase